MRRGKLPKSAAEADLQQLMQENGIGAFYDAITNAGIKSPQQLRFASDQVLESAVGSAEIWSKCKHLFDAFKIATESSTTQTQNQTAIQKGQLVGSSSAAVEIESDAISIENCDIDQMVPEVARQDEVVLELPMGHLLVGQHYTPLGLRLARQLFLVFDRGTHMASLTPICFLRSCSLFGGPR